MTQELLQIQHLDIEKLVPSPTNPRKHFDPAKLKELENSMREQGFTLSVMLVRPLPMGELVIEGDEKVAAMHFIVELLPGDKKRSLEAAGSRREAEEMVEKLRDRYEIVCGECRWRGAKAASIHEVPCIVRELTDQQVLILQLIENLQRTDLSPIEEADGYALVLAQKDAEGKPLYTIEKLAKEIGKDPHVVYRKMRLARLEPNCEIRAALENGTLPVTTAVILAGIPDPEMRAQAAKEVLFPQHEEGPLSRQRTQMLVDEKYRRDLEKAGFDITDKDLLPAQYDYSTGKKGEKLYGGPCNDCPCLIGNMKKLDPNIPKEQKNNVCTNLGCFEQKRKNEWARWQATETDPEKKRRALTEKECKELFRYGYFQSTSLVDLSEHPDSRDLRPGEQSPGTWKKLIKGAGVEVLVARDKDGKTRELVDREQARTAAVKINKVKQLRPIEPERAATEDEQRVTVLTRNLEAERTEFVSSARLGAIIGAVETMAVEPADFWYEFIRLYIDYMDGEAVTALAMRRQWWGKDEDFDEDQFLTKVKELKPREAQGVAVELLISESNEDFWALWAKMFGADLKATGKEAERQWKEKLKAEKAAEEEAAKALAPGIEWKKPLPGDFVWNEHGTCTNAAVLALALPKADKPVVEISVAAASGYWYTGYDVKLNKPNAPSGSSAAPSMADKPRATMLQAIVDEAYGCLGRLKEMKAGTKAIEALSGHIQTLNGLLEAETSKVDPHDVELLCGSPAGNANFEAALTRATPGTLKSALEKLGDKPGAKAEVKKITGRYAALMKGVEEKPVPLDQGTGKRPKLSPEARERVAAAQRARWAAQSRKAKK